MTAALHSACKVHWEHTESTKGTDVLCQSRTFRTHDPQLHSLTDDSGWLTVIVWVVGQHESHLPCRLRTLQWGQGMVGRVFLASATFFFSSFFFSFFFFSPLWIEGGVSVITDGAAKDLIPFVCTPASACCARVARGDSLLTERGGHEAPTTWAAVLPCRHSDPPVLGMQRLVWRKSPQVSIEACVWTDFNYKRSGEISLGLGPFGGPPLGSSGF